VSDGRRTLGLVLLIGVALMAAVAICAWVGVLPLGAESRNLVAIVFACAAAADAIAALFLLTRS
jgi:hypothetical protein